MVAFLNIYPLLSVLLRAMTLAGAALAIGGVIFRFVVAREDNTSERRLLFGACVLLIVSQSAALTANAAVLVLSGGLALPEIAGASFFVCGISMIIGAIFIALTSRSRFAAIFDPTGCLLILGGTVLTSHAAARLEYRGLVGALTGLHQLAAAAWIGGMPFLLLSLRRLKKSAAAAIVKRFSTLAMISVAMLAGAGAAMSVLYVGAISALGETTYGIMLTSKAILTMLLLALGAANLQIVQSIRKGRRPALLRLRRCAEVEVGIGATVILAAASLTSSPPAIDVHSERVSPSEIETRMAPRWPRMTTPRLDELLPVTPFEASVSLPESFVPGQQAYRNAPPDIAWSEYNHHWAGLIVLVAGALSAFAGRWRWARIWPLTFLGLAAFILIRADSENWPLGPRGFWSSFQIPEVAQHRVFVLLIVLFAVFEWCVETGRIPAGRAALIFPAVCALGGALLLTHSHSLGNTKEEFLAELSHTPLALLAVIAGWSRWLEMRLQRQSSPLLHYLCPVCLILIGGILMNYREA